MNTQPERIKVLYVDDEEGNLMAFRAGFRRDLDVRTATSAQEGMDILREWPAHVVLSDQRMPGTSGAEFLALVRREHPEAIRIMLTGYSDIGAVVDAVNNGGIHAYITKPWDPIDLKLRIEQAYEMYALRAARERMFQRYRQVFDAAGDPIVIVDETGTLLDANPATEKLLGIPREQLLSTNIRSFAPKADELAVTMATHREGTAFKNIEITIATPQGAMLDCLMTATYQGRTPEGKALFQAMIKDITDRKQEEKRQKEQNYELDRRVDSRTAQRSETLKDLEAFNGDSAGYSEGKMIKSVLTIPGLNPGDTCKVQFLGAWDEFSAGSNPNWEINAVKITSGAATLFDETFTAGNGALTGTIGWVFDDGTANPGPSYYSFSRSALPVPAGHQFDRMKVSQPANWALSTSEFILIAH